MRRKNLLVVSALYASMGTGRSFGMSSANFLSVVLFRLPIPPAAAFETPRGSDKLRWLSLIVPILPELLTHLENSILGKVVIMVRIRCSQACGKPGAWFRCILPLSAPARDDRTFKNVDTISPLSCLSSPHALACGVVCLLL
jgi:hypothetical protein